MILEEAADEDSDYESSDSSNANEQTSPSKSSVFNFDPELDENGDERITDPRSPDYGRE